jgi:hypothetical protein
MEKEFVPYEQALALKELGFDEICIATYDEDEYFDFLDFEQSYYTIPSKLIQAPLFQQAFRWFREKYDLHHVIKMFGDWDKPQFSYIVSGRTMTNPAHMWHYEEENTYEEAELACLKKLIEITKKK